jgi:hypothetical protein
VPVLAVEAAESQVKASKSVEKAGAAIGKKKSKGKVAVQTTIDQSEVKVYKSEFEFDAASIEKAGAALGKKKSKGKVAVQTTKNAGGKKTSKGKVAVAATTIATVTTMHKAKVKPFEFDFNVASVKNNETKAADDGEIKVEKKLVDLFEVYVDAVSIKNDENKAADDGEFEVEEKLGRII